MHSTVDNLVSTIVPVYNRPEMLVEAVESVLRQSYPRWEIIISDDGSTDETTEVGRQLEKDHPGKVRYLWNANQGAGLAREAGRRVARGEFVQYLDSDDRLLPDKFELQVAALLSNPKCGIAYGITTLVDETGAIMKSPFKWTGEKIEGLFPKLLVDRWWCTHTPLYRRDICDSIGPWTNLKYSQDWEYDGRAGSLGVPLVHVPKPVSEHRHHGGSRQTGHGDWLTPADRARFFELMLAYARKAGVSHDAPEMRHFSRWVFFHSRECGNLGDSTASVKCYHVAREAAGENLHPNMVAYARIAQLLGWSITGRLSTFLHRFFRREPGNETLKQSWMK